MVRKFNADARKNRSSRRLRSCFMIRRAVERKQFLLKSVGSIERTFRKNIMIYDLFEHFMKFGFREDRSGPVYLSP